MAINITLPKITSGNPTEQMRQMQSYVYQLAEQLNWAFSTIEASSPGNVSPDIKIEQGTEVSEKDAESTFSSIKSLIIKSADIVKAYEDTIVSNFKGKYFADSDFGTYVKETSRSVVENSEMVTDTFTRVQTIESKVADIKKETDLTEAYIKRGLLDEDKAIYGVEVGEKIDGKFSKYARFTADRLSFYDENGSEVAYIGAGCLYIVGKSVFQGDVQFGGYKLDTTDGLAFTWIG